MWVREREKVVFYLRWFFNLEFIGKRFFGGMDKVVISMLSLLGMELG